MDKRPTQEAMILIEVSNQDTRSNIQLLKETEKWAKENIEGEYTIVLNPNLKVPMRITKGKVEADKANEGDIKES